MLRKFIPNCNNSMILYLLLLAVFKTTISFGQAFNVMTYNIRLDVTHDGINNWDHRKEAMAELLHYYSPDIFGIQEGLPHQVYYLDSILKNYTYVGVGRDDGINAGEYSAIFYDSTKFTVIENSTFWLSETPDEASLGWDAAYKRICTYGLFRHKILNVKIWIFNTHFDHMGEIAREKSAELILNKISTLNCKKLPVILMGDLNSLPDSKPIQILNTELKDVFSSSFLTPYGPRGTFNGFDPDALIDKRIDYIYVQKLTVLSMIHIDDRRKDNHFLSDHLPVMSKIKFLKN